MTPGHVSRLGGGSGKSLREEEGLTAPDRTGAGLSLNERSRFNAVSPPSSEPRSRARGSPGLLTDARGAWAPPLGALTRRPGWGPGTHILPGGTAPWPT